MNNPKGYISKVTVFALCLAFLVIGFHAGSVYFPAYPAKQLTEIDRSSLDRGVVKVVGVSDGDTVKVLLNGLEEKVRLGEIDCPETRQAFGKKAKQFTSSMVFGKQVKLIQKERDRYGRIVGEIILEDGRSLNRELVKAGLAWWHQKYSNDFSIGALEQQARESKLGLWADKKPIAPWDFRHPPRVTPKPNTDTTIQPGPGGAIDPITEPKPEPIQQGKICGSKNSSKYHMISCRHAGRIKDSNLVYYKDWNDAESRGKTPCKTCGGGK